jgi:Phage integrase family
VSCLCKTQRISGTHGSLPGCAWGTLALFYKLRGGGFLSDVGASLFSVGDCLSRHPCGLCQVQTLQASNGRIHPVEGGTAAKSDRRQKSRHLSSGLRAEEEWGPRLVSIANCWRRGLVVCLGSYDQVWRVSQEAAKAAGIGTHSLRHTYRTWLDSAGTPLGVQQQLMRHGDIRTTMNVYGDAATADMAEAHGKVLGLALNGLQAKLSS